MAIKGLTNWDPFRMMRTWDPFTELREMQHEMAKLFDRFGFERQLPAAESGFGSWMPAIESYTSGNNLVVKCELPGVDPKEVDVTVDEKKRMLLVKGERKSEKEGNEENYIHRELTYGYFERRFTLPEGVKADQVKAKFMNGILEISMPTAMLEKAKKIAIETPKVIEGETGVKKAA